MSVESTTAIILESDECGNQNNRFVSREELTLVYPLSVYVHIPFCATKCSYCAFNTYTNLDHLVPAFVDALAKEIAFVSVRSPQRRVGTIFLGGGTPSLLSVEQHEAILSALRTAFELAPDCEITLEANPNDISSGYAEALREMGYNRISLGMQSATPRDLALFRRRHDVDDVTRAVSAARMGGFDNINLDLIYGIPHQTRDEWVNTVQQALALGPAHISLYALSVEEHTPMKTWVERGVLPVPEDDLAADMYEDAEALMTASGMHQYEISNWAQAGRACRHNLQYWRSLPYLGLGPGAHGFADMVRYSTTLSPQRYIQSLNEMPAEEVLFPLSPAVAEWTTLSADDEISETLIMGLRLTEEGIGLRSFEARFGISLLERFGEILRRFSDQGLVSMTESHVCLSSRGRLLSNLIFRELV